MDVMDLTNSKDSPPPAAGKVQAILVQNISSTNSSLMRSSLLPTFLIVHIVFHCAFQALVHHTWTRETLHSISDNTEYKVPNLVNVHVRASELKRILSNEDSTDSWLSCSSFDAVVALLKVIMAGPLVWCP